MCRSCRTIVGGGAEINLASTAWHLRAVEQARGARHVMSLRRHVDGVSATSRHRDAVDVAVRESTRLAREPRQLLQVSQSSDTGGYTGVTYNPTRRQVLIGPGRGVKDHFVQQLDSAARNKRFQNQPLQFKRIRDLYPHFEYSDLAAHPCIVLIPYQVSLMSIFEYYRMGIPMWAPAPELLAQWQLKYRVMSERTWDLVRKKRPTRGSPLPRAPGASHRHDPNDEFDIKAIAFWIKYADFYEWPHISTFTSFDDLVQQLTSSDLDLRGISQRVIAYNEEMVRDLKGEWRSIFAKMFHGLKPAASEPREQKRNYDEALLAKYGARQSDRCVGDAFDGAAFDWLRQ